MKFCRPQNQEAATARMNSVLSIPGVVCADVLVVGLLSCNLVSTVGIFLLSGCLHAYVLRKCVGRQHQHAA